MPNSGFFCLVDNKSANRCWQEPISLLEAGNRAGSGLGCGPMVWYGFGGFRGLATIVSSDLVWIGGVTWLVGASREAIWYRLVGVSGELEECFFVVLDRYWV